MDLDTQFYPFAYHKGKVTTFKRGTEFARSYFGGPADFKVKGIEHGPKKLHHIASILNSDVGLDVHGHGGFLPFYYGMCFDGCELEYSCSYMGYITINKMEPVESIDDWPYDDYPRYLPYFPLEVDEQSEVSNEQIIERLCQYVDEVSDDTFVFVVPSNPELGFSMWGPSGDAEGVELIFLFDTKTGTVRIHNVCS